MKFISKLRRFYQANVLSKVATWIFLIFLAFIITFLLETLYYSRGKFNTNTIEAFDFTGTDVNLYNMEEVEGGYYKITDNEDSYIIYTFPEAFYLHKFQIRFVSTDNQLVDYEVTFPDLFIVGDSFYHAETHTDEWDTVTVDGTVSSIMISFFEAAGKEITIEFGDVSYNYPLNYIRMAVTFISTLVLFFTLLCSLGMIRFKLENVTLVYLIIFSCIFSFLIPPRYSWDEYAHLTRSIYIANGHLTAGPNVETVFPYNYDLVHDLDYRSIEDFYAYLDTLDNPDNITTPASHLDTSAETYIFIPYLLSALGVKVAELLHLSAFYVSAFARLFNALFYSIAVFLAMKLFKAQKMLLAFLAMIPNMVFAANTAGPGAVLNGLLFLGIGLIAYLRINKKQISAWAYLGIMVIFIIVTISRMTYGFFILLLLLLPKDQFKNKWLGKFNIGIALVVSVLTMGIVYYYSSHIGGFYSFDYAGVNPTEQLKLIIKNPFTFLKRTWFMTSQQLVTASIGNELINTVYNGSISALFGLISLLILTLLTFSGKRDELTYNTIGSRIMIYGTTLLSYLATVASMYVTINAYNSLGIGGVQPRYIFSMLVVFLPAFQGRDFYFHTNRTVMKNVIVYYIWFMFILIFGTILVHFYS